MDSQISSISGVSQISRAVRFERIAVLEAAIGIRRQQQRSWWIRFAVGASLIAAAVASAWTLFA